MKIVNLVAKFQVLPNTQAGSFMVTKGEINIFGGDDATIAGLLGKFSDLKVSTYSSPSPSASSGSSSSAKNVDGSFLCSAQENGEIMRLDLAIAEITQYLGVLEGLDFTIVSAFKDELFDAGNESKYKMYMWTLQKAIES